MMLRHQIDEVIESLGRTTTTKMKLPTCRLYETQTQSMYGKAEKSHRQVRLTILLNLKNCSHT